MGSGVKRGRDFRLTDVAGKVMHDIIAWPAC
jgi:hypothetical protein